MNANPSLTIVRVSSRSTLSDIGREQTFLLLVSCVTSCATFESEYK